MGDISFRLVWSGEIKVVGLEFPGSDAFILRQPKKLLPFSQHCNASTRIFTCEASSDWLQIYRNNTDKLFWPPEITKPGSMPSLYLDQNDFE